MNTRYGIKVDVQCDKGYHLVGNTSIFCNTDGEWTDTNLSRCNVTGWMFYCYDILQECVSIFYSVYVNLKILTVLKDLPCGMYNHVYTILIEYLPQKRKWCKRCENIKIITIFYIETGRTGDCSWLFAVFTRLFVTALTLVRSISRGRKYRSPQVRSFTFDLKYNLRMRKYTHKTSGKRRARA